MDDAPDVIDCDPAWPIRAERNARYMPPQQYQQLIDNIRRDGFLASTPYLWADPEEPDQPPACLSGNHRLDAARDAGLDTVRCLLDRRALTEGQRTAIQLSHNAIAGLDDEATLAALYTSLDDITDRAYSGLDDATVGVLESISLAPLSDPDLDHTAVTLLFLPDDADRLTAALGALQEHAKADTKIAARHADLQPLTDALDDIAAASGISNRAVALTLLLDVHEAHLTDVTSLTQADDRRKRTNWLTLATIVGTRRIPQDAAEVITQALDRMVERGDVNTNSRWRALEMWAADHLSAP